MAKVRRDSLWDSFLSADVYQWKQGKVVRRSTAAAIVLAFLLLSQSLFQSVLYDLGTFGSRFGIQSGSLATFPVGYLIVGLINVLGIWFAFRLINYPVFADFLIDVESEMAKVTWPTWAELRRATMMVLGVMFIITVLLLGYDVVWQAILEFTGVLRLK